jgi:vacuolar-type H+-ATPase subunit E/Vma4
MTTEAQVAMLMLRLLIDRPKELQKVMDYLQREVLTRKAELEAGKRGVATREEILSEFTEKYGLTVDITDSDPEMGSKEILSEEISSRMHGLPTGARFKVG